MTSTAHAQQVLAAKFIGLYDAEMAPYICVWASVQQHGSSEKLIKETINKYTARIPVDIRGMVKELGLALYRGRLRQDRGLLERNLRKGGFSGYLIVVNEAYPVEDQRVAGCTRT